MRTLNLGILAHVDAGKTTLTERLLYAAGVIDEIGSVDAGNDADRLAWRSNDERGITIKSAVVSFVDRRRHRQPDRHARPPGLHRRGRAGAERPRRRRARDLRRRGRAAADPRPDAGVAAAPHSDAALREQDRPSRRERRARAPGDLGATGARHRPDGVHACARHPRAPTSGPGTRTTPSPGPGSPRCSPSATKRSWPRTWRTRRAFPTADSARSSRLRRSARSCIPSSSALRSRERVWSR